MLLAVIAAGPGVLREGGDIFSDICPKQHPFKRLLVNFCFCC
jgi:hypothetical protein